MRLSARLLAASALALSLAAPAFAQDAATIQRAERIRDGALEQNIALDYVTQLTTRFGARPAGSPSEQAAAEWAAQYMREHGFQNVRIETFPLVGWERGEESASIVGANPQRLVVAALGHSPGTNGVIEAEVVRFTSLEELNAAPAGSLAGKIAYIDAGQMVRMQDGAGYGPLTRIRGAGPAAAASKGAVAFIMRSVGSDEHRMPHTGTTRYVEGRVPLPGFALSAPDASQLSRLIASGETVRLRLSSTAHTYETVSQNVVGEITGASRPNEVIVLGSHMDSWDLGTGAIDDGAGVAIVTAAAKLIDELPGRPRRTIRVVHWGAEEVGLWGARAYASKEARGAELARHVVAAESDFGAGRIWRLDTRLGKSADNAVAEILDVLRPLGVGPGDKEAGGGADVGPLREAGVGILDLQQDGSAYFDYHHTANDTLDKIDRADLRQNVAVWAATIYLLSEAAVPLRPEAN